MHQIDLIRSQQHSAVCCCHRHQGDPMVSIKGLPNCKTQLVIEIFPYVGNNSTKGESVQATLSATLLEKKSTKPLNNNIYFDEEDRAQNQSNTSMGVTIIHEHERWDNSLK